MDYSKAKKVFSKFGLVYTVSYWVLAIALTICALVAGAINGEDMSAQWTIGLEIVFRFAIMYPIMLLLVKNEPTFEIEKKRLGVGKFIACIFITFAVMYLSTIVGMILNNILGKITGQGAINQFANVVSNMPTVIRIIAVPILAPVFEELLFRKFLIDRVVGYGEVLAMLISGFMFGLYHANFLQFFYATFLGMFFAFIYIRTGKIGYTIALHLIVNGFSTCIGVLMADGIDMVEVNSYLNSGDMEGYTNYVNEHASALAGMTFVGLFIIVATIVGTILMLVMRKKFVFVHRDGEIEKGKRFQTAICNPGMLLYVIFFTVEIILALYSTTIIDSVMNLF